MNLQVFLEWFHRLDAFLVGLALLVLFGLSLWWRARLPGWFPLFSGASLLLVAVQGGLGALTVTRLLQSEVVTAHLATALGLVALVSAAYQRLAAPPQRPPSGSRRWRPRPSGGLRPVRPRRADGQPVGRGSVPGGRRGCRWLLAHRLGAYPAAVAVLVLVLASLALPRRCRSLQLFSGSALLLVAGQVALGVATLHQQLQWPALTVAHQFDAALLVAVLAATLGRSLSGAGSAQAGPAAGSDSSLPPVEVAHG